MKKTVLLMAILLSGIYSAIAQQSDYVFKVMISSGNNTVIKSGKWESLKIGSKLTATDEVKVEGFLGLEHKNGKTLEVKNAGSYKVSELATKIPAGTSSVAARYAGFVMDKMAKNNSSGTHKSITGSGERGGFIFLWLPKTTNVMEDKVSFHWNALKGTQNYEVLFMDIYDEVLEKRVTKDTNMVFFINDPKFSKAEQVLVKVMSKELPGKGSDSYEIHKLTADEIKAINSDLTSIKSTDNDSSSIQKLVIASFLEDKKLNLEAMEYYEQAMALEPTVDEYKKLYLEFIDNKGVGKPRPKPAGQK